MAENRASSAPKEPDQRLSALQSNAAAVRAVAAAVEGTLGPKGLNCMLVDRAGDVTVTNDGSAILTHIDAVHPAARILVRAARSQDDEVGDGTTTTAIVASALIAEGASHALRGVPVSMLVEGIREGLSAARAFIQNQARLVDGLDDPALFQCVLIASRGEEAIASAVLKAGRILGAAKLKDPACDLREAVTVVEASETHAFAGLLLHKDRVNRQMPSRLTGVRCLVLADALEPETVEAEALATDRGFSAYMDAVQRFKAHVDALAQAGVGLVAVQKGLHDSLPGGGAGGRGVRSALAGEHGFLVLRLFQRRVDQPARERERDGLLAGLDDLLDPDLGHQEALLIDRAEGDRVRPVGVQVERRLVHGLGRNHPGGQFRDFAFAQDLRFGQVARLARRARAQPHQFPHRRNRQPQDRDRQHHLQQRKPPRTRQAPR